MAIRSSLKMIFGPARRLKCFRVFRVQKKCWKPEHLLAVISLLAMSLAPACKSESGLFVRGNGIPTFEIRRSFFDEVKVFPILTVVELDPDNERLPPLHEDKTKNKVLWRVVADSAAEDKTPIENLASVEYGKVPKGFIQEVPENGGPQPLVEGKTYEAVGPVSLMRNASVRFRIADGKVVTVKTPE